MKAKFTSICIGCDGQIKRGMEIVKSVNQRWVHKHCAAETTNLS